ncbi:MAG: hypothetical protein A2W19_12130 [Spirochaetes bacterium RBG_16_49_21]|nr:MAG: hypothetical protein A2W19_12130 [Spirochaetes bacterium RBG_16_49_21]
MILVFLNDEFVGHEFLLILNKINYLIFGTNRHEHEIWCFSNFLGRRPLPIILAERSIKGSNQRSLHIGEFINAKELKHES